MNTKLYKELKNKIVEIYSEEGSSKFDVGRLLGFDGEWLYFALYDTYGRQYGASLLREENVFALSENTRYLKDLLRPEEEKKQPYPVFEEGEDLLNGLLSRLSKDEIFYVELEDGFSTWGKLTNEGKHFKVESFSCNGLYDGTVYLKADAVKVIRFGIDDCENLQKSIHAR